MLDKFELRFDLADCQNIWQRVRKGSVDPTGRYISGKIKNLKVTQNTNSLRICGSMGKFLNGENITHFERRDAKRGFDEIAELSGLDVSKGEIVYFEFGDVFYMSEEPKEYLKIFDYDKKRTRIQYGKADLETVEYRTETGQYSFCAYDKKAECADKGGDIPEDFRDDNLLRMELRFQNPKLTFGRTVRAYDFADGVFWQGLVKRFYDFYMAIPKSGKDVFIDRTKEISYAELKNLFAVAFRELNPEEYAMAVADAELGKRGKEMLRGWEKTIKTADYTARGRKEAELDGAVNCLCGCWLH